MIFNKSIVNFTSCHDVLKKIATLVSSFYCFKIHSIRGSGENQDNFSHIVKFPALKFVVLSSLVEWGEGMCMSLHLFERSFVRSVPGALFKNCLVSNGKLYWKTCHHSLLMFLYNTTLFLELALFSKFYRSLLF